MVWIVLEQLDRGMSWDEILREWPGKFPKAAISEAIAISDLVVKHEAFKGFNVGGFTAPLLATERLLIPPLLRVLFARRQTTGKRPLRIRWRWRRETDPCRAR